MRVLLLPDWLWWVLAALLLVVAFVALPLAPDLADRFTGDFDETPRRHVKEKSDG